MMETLFAETTRPRMLAVTSQLPWPLNSGGNIRTYHLLRSLARRFSVTLLTSVPVGDAAGIDRLKQEGIALRPVWQRRRRWLRESLKAAAAGFNREPYVLYRRHHHSAVRAALGEAVRAIEPQFIYLDHLDAFVYRDVLPRVPVVLDLHNIYSKLTARLASEKRNPLMKGYLDREAELLAEMEKQAARSVDGLMSVSAEEQRHFESLGARRACVIPNGVDCARYAHLPIGRAGSQPAILFLGTLSWPPNREAARFLAHDVMPVVRQRVPAARLWIVGRHGETVGRELQGQDGVDVFGEVPDVIPYLADARLLAVPLNSGGGTRLKILEAFAAGLPVLSTPIGAEGIAARSEEHLLLRSRGEFAEGALNLLEDGDLARRCAAQARRLVQDNYDWQCIGEQAAAFVKSVCAEPAAVQGER